MQLGFALASLYPHDDQTPVVEWPSIVPLPNIVRKHGTYSQIYDLNAAGPVIALWVAMQPRRPAVVLGGQRWFFGPSQPVIPGARYVERVSDAIRDRQYAAESALR